MKFFLIVEQYEPESAAVLRTWKLPFQGDEREAQEAANQEAKRLKELGFGGIEDWYAIPA